MELILVKWLLLGVIVWTQIHAYRGCFEAERLALLLFKASLGSDSDHLLPSWVDDDPMNDCCKWERVTCSSITGHVTELALNDSRDIGGFPARNYCEFETGGWLVNMSMFQQIKELRSLDLSLNGIAGSVQNGGFERLNKLETLNLDGNCFYNNKRILSSVGSLTSLKTLVLSFNHIEGAFPIQVGSLENLEMLDLSDSEFDTAPPVQDFKRMSKLSKLKQLDLSLNFFSDDILSFLSMFSSLETLNLSDNFFKWPLFNQGLDNLKVLKLSNNIGFNRSTLRIQTLCGLKRLEELDLSHNNFEGSVPECLQNLTSLRVLDVSWNNFIGQISSSLVSSLNSLRYIDFRHNLFEGLFSFKEFSNHSSLEVVQFKSGNDKFKIVTEYPNWVPPFQLEALVLQNCSLQEIPEFLFHQFKLKLVDLSDNKIKARFPNWLFENNTGLEFISLKNNCFEGQINDLPGNISWLDFSYNCFDEQFAEIRGKKFLISNIKFLNLSKNSFQGDFPFSIGEDCKLMSLDLSSNNFTGEIPEELVSNCLSLRILKLSHNNFHGQILPSQLNLSRLWSLELNDNQFIGTVPRSVTKDFRLSVLDVSNNSFHGEIPRWIGNVTNLDFIIMRNNFLIGQISCKLLESAYIDLSYNSLSGSLPSCYNQSVRTFLQNPVHLNLQGNMFFGPIPEDFLHSSDLLSIDLRDNNFSGSISKTFDAFRNLRILSLAGNHFNGNISNRLCHLKRMNLLDLSRNFISGSIPLCFTNISFGTLGFRDFSFEIPSSISIPLDKVFSAFAGIGEITSEYSTENKIKEEFEFVTKHRGNTYKGSILNIMNGLDLSQNNFTGEIPYELGILSQIRALNLSHNQLIGSIPKSFSNFSQLESLDLSYNNLSGVIPSELIELHFLSAFTVVHNNLSGKIPDMKRQFSTFESSSYEGNPFLCGPPLKDCYSNNVPPTTQVEFTPEADGKWYEVDPVVFFTSFSVSFFMFFLAVVTFLYANSYWRQWLFYYSQEFVISCYYFLYDNLFRCLFVRRLYR